MNKLTLENKRDFPLSTNALKFMQNAYLMLEKLAAIGGDNYIVSGCVLTGGSVSAGYMVLNGQLMPFKAGSKTANVQIVETKTTVTVEAATREEVSYHAEFGLSSDPAKNVAWDSIKSFDALVSVTERLKTAETTIDGHGTTLTEILAGLATIEAFYKSIDITEVACKGGNNTPLTLVEIKRGKASFGRNIFSFQLEVVVEKPFGTPLLGIDLSLSQINLSANAVSSQVHCIATGTGDLNEFIDGKAIITSASPMQMALGTGEGIHPNATGTIQFCVYGTIPITQ